MAQIYLDRLKKRFGWVGGKYKDLISIVVGTNQSVIANSVAKISARRYYEIADKLVKRHKKKGTEFKLIIPNPGDILPQKRAFIIKAAEQGQLISDTLRRAISKDLRDTLLENKSVSRYGKLNDFAEGLFERKIKKTFTNYTVKNSKFGVPTNVHTIAVTEIRSVVNNIRDEFANNFQSRNPHTFVLKKWIHNPHLSKEPRDTHAMVATFKPIKYYEKFPVPNIKGGIDHMSYPHDPAAPINQVIGCHCECEYIVVINENKIMIK